MITADVTRLSPPYYRYHVAPPANAAIFIPILPTFSLSSGYRRSRCITLNAIGDSKYSFMQLTTDADSAICSRRYAARLLSLLLVPLSPSAGLACRYCYCTSPALGPQWAAEGVFMLCPVYLHRRAPSVWGCWANTSKRIYNDVRARPRYLFNKLSTRKARRLLSESHQ